MQPADSQSSTPVNPHEEEIIRSIMEDDEYRAAWEAEMNECRDAGDPHGDDMAALVAEADRRSRAREKRPFAHPPTVHTVQQPSIAAAGHDR